VRRIAVVCAVLAASARAHAQLPVPPPTPGAPDPTASAPGDPPPPSGPAAPDPAATPGPGGPPGTAELPQPPPAAVPRQPSASAAAQIDRELADEQCRQRDPSCDWISTLSSLERASVVRAIAARGYVVEPSPWNKVIGAVRVYNEEVFAEGNRLLKFFNHFHVTTKETTIRAEAVVSAGETWDQERIEETGRRLRDPLWTSVVAVIPVRSATPGQVDALIVTRDIWSLRLNTQYTFQQGKLTNLTMSFSENNFLGRRNVLAAGVTMDQGSIAVGPLFIDKNFLGKRLDLRARIDDVVNRDDLFNRGRFHSEGTQSTITLSRPLWSLASKWAAGVSFTHRYAIDRQYLGTTLRTFTYTDPETSAVTMFERQYAMRRWGTNAYATRQWGGVLKHQLSLGHSYDHQRPRPLSTFTGDAAQRAAFVAGVLPRSEVTSVPFVEYALFTPRYRTLRNITTFDLAEDARIGPDLNVSLGFGLRILGSDAYFQRFSASAGWTVPWARDGFVRAAAGLGSRLEHGELIDNSASGSIRGATPALARTVRFMVQTSLATRWRDTQNRFYEIGSDTGLRGFAINEFIGQRRVSLQVEARTLPYPVWALRLGAVVFYDLGGAADSFSQLALHHDVGLGFRVLIPQTSAQLFKIDLAVPLDGDDPGAIRLLSGFGSEF
jgi:hypothetical protein